MSGTDLIVIVIVIVVIVIVIVIVVIVIVIVVVIGLVVVVLEGSFPTAEKLDGTLTGRHFALFPPTNQQSSQFEALLVGL